MRGFNDLAQEKMKYSNSKVRRALFRAPLILWRLGFGPLLGRAFVLLTARGRKSGLPRRWMTEYHVLRGKIYIPCAYWEHAQWYKNLKADPHVTAQTWQGAEAMIAHRVTDEDELREVVALIFRRNRAMMEWYLKAQGLAPTVADAVAHKERVFIFRLDPTDEIRLFPLEADLAWLWPAMLAVLALVKLLRREH